MEIFLIWLALAVVTAVAAGSRGRSGAAWFFIGLFTGVFGLIAVLVMENLSKPQAEVSNEPRPFVAPTTAGGIVHRGYAIVSTGNGYATAGQMFDSLGEAEAYINRLLAENA